MTAHVDILDQKEPLQRPLAASLTIHVLVVGLAMLGTWYNKRNATRWGDPNSLGGAMGITPVSQIPLPQRAASANLVANDSRRKRSRKPARSRKRI